MNKKPHYHEKIAGLLFAGLFLLGIFLPLITGAMTRDLKISTIEKRTLSPFPAAPIDLKTLTLFPSAFTKYYADHFGFRDWLAGRYHRLKYRIGDSPSDKVIIGKNKWMFLGSIRHTGHNDPIGDIRNINPYTETELEEFSANISAMNSHLKAQNIEYVFVLVPNKHTIYFEYLPDYIVKENRPSAMDQLITYLQANTDVNVLDLRDSLFAAKKTPEAPLYFKTDTHWNHQGANIGQYEIMKNIAQKLPNALAPERRKLRSDTISGNDLARFIGTPSLSEKSFHPIFDHDCTPSRTPEVYVRRQDHQWACADQKLKTLIFGDSFFINLSPYFARKFLHTTVKYSPLNAEQLMAEINESKPDIVIEEWVERLLPKPYPDAFRLANEIHAEK